MQYGNYYHYRISQKRPQELHVFTQLHMSDLCEDAHVHVRTDSSDRKASSTCRF